MLFEEQQQNLCYYKSIFLVVETWIVFFAPTVATLLKLWL